MVTHAALMGFLNSAHVSGFVKRSTVSHTRTMRRGKKGKGGRGKTVENAIKNGEMGREEGGEVGAMRRQVRNSKNPSQTKLNTPKKKEKKKR